MTDLFEYLKHNAYPGRGIFAGRYNGENVIAYFIMGRSANSRNRIFLKKDDILFTRAYDESKVADPSLIIYNAIRTCDDKTIVTNGNQTDTIYDFLKEGKTFEEALATREYEPDAPNFTPRISGIISFAGGAFSYKLSILKSCDDKGTDCNRFTFAYAPVAGLGHFLHTYVGDGSPIPSFVGEPEPVDVDNDIDSYTAKLWDSLNEDNKVSLYVNFTDPADGSSETRIVNKNK